MANRKTGRPTVCAHCGDDFLSYRVGVRFCSRRCAGRASRVGRPLTGASNPRFNHGLSTWQGRTVVVLRSGSWQLYSRAVMEGHLRRHLAPCEIVHHVNGDPTDDRVENLRVLSRSEHLAEHRGELASARRRRAGVRAAA